MSGKSNPVVNTLALVNALISPALKRLMISALSAAGVLPVTQAAVIPISFNSSAMCSA